MTKLKHLLLLAAISTTFMCSAFEVRYSRPVKALVTVSTVGGDYVVSGLFEHETRFSAAMNRERERKYVRLFAENTLIRFLKKNGVSRVTFSGASITSNRTSAGPNDKISFKYVIPQGNCTLIRDPAPVAAATVAAAQPAEVKKTVEPAPDAAAPQPPEASKPADNAAAPQPPEAPKPADNAAAPQPAEASKPADNAAAPQPPEAQNSADPDVEAEQFEIASPNEIFDASWRVTAEQEAAGQKQFDKLIQDFERRK